MSVGALRLDLGDLDLANADGGYDTFSFAVLGEDVDFGEPVPVETVIASLMGDGDVTEVDRYSNRSIAFRVVVEAADAGGLADGEAMLDSVVGTRTTLTWQPPDDYGPATVFAVETVRKRFLFSDLDEVRRVKNRTFQLTLNCLPFGRSATETIVDAEAVSSTVTIADECQSTSGWSSLVSEGASGNQGGTFSVDSTAGYFISGTGSMKVTPAGAPNYQGGLSTASQRFKKSSLSIDASAGGYLIFWLRMEWPGSHSQVYKARVTSSGGGEQVAEVLTIEAAANGFVKYAILVPNHSTITALDLDVWQGRAGFPGGSNLPHVWIDAIGLAPAASTASQLKAFDVGGSMRSEGSFEIAATAGLGDALLYTCPDLDDGFRPDLRRWQASGTSSTDVAAVNGTYVLSSAAPTFDAPANIFRPGAYAVLVHGRASSTGSTPLTVTAQTRLGSTNIGPASTASSGAVTLPDQTYYYAIRVGVLDLPPLAVDPASGATVRFTVTGSGTAVKIDELLVFPLEDSALTWIRCGKGAGSATVMTRVFIDAPSSMRPRGQVLVGNAADRTDARAVVPLSRGRHMLYPGRMLAYLLASASSGGPGLSPRYFKQWHTNAAEDG